MDLFEAFKCFIKEEYSKGNSSETISYYNYNIPNFIEYCKNNGIVSTEQITKNVFDEYKCFLLSSKKNTQKISLQTYARAVKVFLNWLNSNEIINNIGSLSLIKAEIKNIIPLSDLEVKILLNCFDNSFYGIRNRLVCLLMVDSGLRRGEVVSLLTKNINLINKTILVYGKGDKERIVPFGEETKKYIIKILSLNNKNEPHLIQKNDGECITENTIKMFFQDLKKETGISRLKPHLLRHTFGTNYILYGGELEELRILMGHTSLSMTQKYVHLAAQQKILNQKYHSHIDKIIGDYDNAQILNVV